MDKWQSYVGTALVGTGRRTPDRPTDDSALAAALRQLDWTQPEVALLGTAGAIALHKKVGWKPERKDFASLEPCSSKDLPCCSDRLVKLFDKAADKHIAVLPELLELIASIQQRIPAKQLPRLLKLGERKKELRPSIQLVLGARGRWLAVQNARWKYATQETPVASQSEVADPVGQQPTPEELIEKPWIWLETALQESQRWDIAFSRLALSRFFEIANIRVHHIELSRLSIPLAMALHPGLASEIAQKVDRYVQDKKGATLQHFLSQLSDTVNLRWEIYQAILSSRQV